MSVGEHLVNARGEAKSLVERFVAGYLRHRQAILFYSLLLTLVARPMLLDAHVDTELLRLFLFGNLLVALAATGTRSGRRRRLFEIFVGVSIAAYIGTRLFDVSWLDTVFFVILTSVLLFATWSLILFAVRARSVAAEHIYAVVSSYLLFGLFAGILYMAVIQIWPNSFAMHGVLIRPEAFTLQNAIYFSFMTVTTLGYGDLEPIGEVARGLAILEAVAGQLYLTVMVARLVGLYGASLTSADPS
jgi:hypothetical protein